VIELKEQLKFCIKLKGMELYQLKIEEFEDGNWVDFGSVGSIETVAP
jgi:hypothetical protein